MTNSLWNRSTNLYHSRLLCLLMISPRCCNTRNSIKLLINHVWLSTVYRFRSSWTKLCLMPSRVGSSRNWNHGMRGKSVSDTYNTRSNTRYVSNTNLCTMLRNWFILNSICLYRIWSPTQSILPGAVLVYWIFILYARLSNIHCIAPWLPRIMHLSTIRVTNANKSGSSSSGCSWSSSTC